MKPTRFSRPARRLCAGLLCLLLAACGGKPAISTAQTAETAVRPTASTPAPTAAPAAPGGEDEVPTILPETADAGRSYVDETLFIGDSNTARYMMYADDTGTAFTSLANNIGVVSMGAGSITTLACEQFKGDSRMYTIPQAVAMLKPRRIVIGFGTNNLSGSSTDATSFIETYRKGLAAIAEAWPYADIIVSAIPPLDKQRDNQNLTMTQVDAYNAALVTLCEEDGYKFLNTAEVLRDDATGWARADYTLSDGVHLSKTAVTALFGYLRTHAYVTPDRRPQPLGSLPTPAGTPLGLISSDPIAVRGAKVPVEFVASTGGAIRGSTSQLVKKGGSCSTVTAVPDAGWKFSHWSVSLGSAGAGASLTFTVPSNADAGGVVVTANFTPDEHTHEFVDLADTRVAPTCEAKGSVKRRCTICGETVEVTLDATGHSWDGGQVTKEPQPGQTGVRTYTCQNCGATRTEPIEALSVTPSPAPAPEPTPDQTPDQTPDPTPSQPAAPTPTPHEHSYDSFDHTKKPATCTKDGVDIYRCACGATAERPTPATGHSWDEGQITIEPQPGRAGERTYTCRVCSVTRTEPIDPLPVETPPAEPSPDVPSGDAPQPSPSAEE